VITTPKYKLNKTIANFLQKTERRKTEFDLLPQPKLIEKYTRQKSILKSAVYSARIEGNPKTIKEVSLTSIKNSREKHKRELANLYQALEYCLQRTWRRNLQLTDIKKLHELTLQHLSPAAGNFRRQPSAIFNQAGIAVYVCPPPQQIKKLLTKWLAYVNSPSEPLIPIKAALSHFWFEKIHPFLDGNGRVGRLLIHTILKKWSYDLRGLVAFEEYLDINRQTYYELLNLNQKDITPFVEFFLKGLDNSLQKAVKEKDSITHLKKEDLLPPRRYEILQIIRDHRQVSFDFIRRRFFTVSERLLRYDLKKLQDNEFIRKRGITKGAVYEPK
jgi:Fic family protein